MNDCFFFNLNSTRKISFQKRFNFSAYSDETIKRTKTAFSSVNAKTVWETYNKRRLGISRDMFEYDKDNSIIRIYTKSFNKKTEIVKKTTDIHRILEQVPKKKEKKNININLSNAKKRYEADDDLSKTKRNASKSPKRNASKSPKRTVKSSKSTKIKKFESSKLSRHDRDTKPRSSRWIRKQNSDSSRKHIPEIPKKLDRDEVATKIARNLRLKQLVKQQLLVSTPSQSTEPQSTQPQSTQPHSTLPQSIPANKPAISINQQGGTPSTNQNGAAKGNKNDGAVQSNSTPKQPKKSGRLLPTPTMAELRAHAAKIIHDHQIARMAQAQVQAQAQAEAQARAVISLQALAQPLIPANPWQTGLLGVPQQSILGAPPDIMAIPDNVVGVPEMQGIRPKLFPPIIPNVPIKSTPLISNFDPDEFEPPSFATIDTPTESAASKSSERKCVTPPPGVDLDEYLSQHEGKDLKSINILLRFAF